MEENLYRVSFDYIESNSGIHGTKTMIGTEDEIKNELYSDKYSMIQVNEQGMYYSEEYVHELECRLMKKRHWWNR